LLCKQSKCIAYKRGCEKRYTNQGFTDTKPVNEEETGSGELPEMAVTQSPGWLSGRGFAL
jgi:hypothetical protein